jgi:hypothetical protein
MRMPIIVIALLFSICALPAAAQSRKPSATPPAPVDIVARIRTVALADLEQATAEAKAMNDTIAAQCYDARIAFAHARQGATPGSGDAPGVVTSFQRARDFVNALRPGSGIKTACAPLAEEMKQDVLGLLGKLATGVLTIPALLPLIP